MKLYSYVIVSDTGFAPNPFGEYCTLATCKPQIRRDAQVGDWVIATGSKRSSIYERLVYAMRVDEVLSIETYDLDLRFALKKPDESVLHGRYGDNIYFKDVAGHWQQRSSLFHGERHMARDLSGVNVLVAKLFYFFGDQAIKIPLELKAIITSGRGYRSKFEDALVAQFVGWLQSNFKAGLHGRPFLMPQLISLSSAARLKN